MSEEIEQPNSEEPQPFKKRRKRGSRGRGKRNKVNIPVEGVENVNVQPQQVNELIQNLWQWQQYYQQWLYQITMLGLDPDIENLLINVSGFATRLEASEKTQGIFHKFRVLLVLMDKVAKDNGWIIGETEQSQPPFPEVRVSDQEETSSVITDLFTEIQDFLNTTRNQNPEEDDEETEE